MEEFPTDFVSNGDVEYVYTTHVVHQEEFYIHLDNRSSILEEIMDALESRYSQLSAHDKTLAQLKLGGLCAAKFTDDNHWYRAKITGILNNGLIEVNFVDYGNTDYVSQDRIKNLDRDLMKYPVQSYRCALGGVSCQYGLWTPELRVQFEDLVIDKKCKAVFSGKTERGMYVLHMYDEAGNYINGMFGAPDRKETAMASKVTNGSHRVEGFGSVTWREGQKVQAVVVYVTDPGVFWCQEVAHTNSIILLSEELSRRHMTQDMIRLRDVRPGSICAAKFHEDNAWYRGIVEVVSGNKAQVNFVDYGNTEAVDLDYICELKPEFRQLPALGVKCNLSSFGEGSASQWPAGLVEEFEKMVVDREFEMDIISRRPDGYEVSLLDVEENKDIGNCLKQLVGQSVARAKISPPKELNSVAAPVKTRCIDLPVGSACRVFLSWIDNPSDFWLQQEHLSDTLDELSTEMQVFYAQPRPVSPSTRGTFVIARFSDDQQWYRGLIVKEFEETVQVLFIDYGNTDTILKTELRQPGPQFGKIDPLAFRCSLKGVKPLPHENTWTADAKDFLEKLTEDGCECKVLEKNEVYRFVALSVNGKDVAQELISLAVVAGNQPVESRPNISQYSNSLQLRENQTEEVVVTHIDSPKSLWIQLCKHSSQLDDVMGKLESHYSEDGGTTIPKPVIGQACVAQYSLDNAWYRATITNVTQSGCNVHFVDYGNTEAVSSRLVCVVEPRFLDLPSQAINCSIDLPEHLKDPLADMVLESEVTLKVLSCIGGVPTIDLILDGQSVCDRLKSSANGIKPGSSTGGISPAKAIPVGSTVQAFTSMVHSPERFFLQMAGIDEELNSLMSQLALHYVTKDVPVIPQPAIGMYCVALYEEDKQWYRGIITSIEGGQCKVMFVDYGNEELISKHLVKTLVPEVSSAPIMAYECSLHGVSAKTWSESSITLFETVVMDQELNCTFVSNSSVTLICNGEDVARKLISDGHCQSAGGSSPVVQNGFGNKSPKKPEFDENENRSFGGGRREESNSGERGNRGFGGNRQEGRGFGGGRKADGDEWNEKKSFGGNGDAGSSKSNNPLFRDGDSGGFGGRGGDRGDGGFGRSGGGRDNDSGGFGRRGGDRDNDSGGFGRKGGDRNGESGGFGRRGGDRDNDSGGFGRRGGDRDNDSGGFGRRGGDRDGESGGFGKRDRGENDSAGSSSADKFTYADPPSDPESAILVHIDDDGTFYLQLPSMEKDIVFLSKRLAGSYKSGGGPRLKETAAKGTVCCCKFPDDGSMYRCQVEEISSNKAIVRYMDFGNVVEHSTYDLKYLFPDLLQYPVQAFPCKLRGFEWSMEQAETFGKSTLDKDLEVTFTSTSAPFEVDIKTPDGDLLGIMTGKIVPPAPKIAASPKSPGTGGGFGSQSSKGFGGQRGFDSSTPQKSDSSAKRSMNMVSSPPKPSVPKQQFKSQTAPSNSKTAFISHVGEDGSFYLQLEEDTANLDTLTEKLVSVDSSIPHPDLARGSACAAIFSDDSTWYRALISEIEDTQYTVTFVDFGNGDKVAKESICPLKEELLSSAPLAYHCRFAEEEEMSDESRAKLEEYMMEHQMTVSFNSQNAPFEVTVTTVDGQDLHEIVCPSNKFRIQKAPTDVTPVGVSHIEDDGRFFACIYKQYKNKDKLHRLLQKECTSSSMEPLENVEIDVPCCAKSSSDEQWYRVKITGVSDSEADIMYVDFGKSEKVETSELKSLPAVFLKEAPFALECRLKGVESWTGDLKEKFIAMTEDKILNATFYSTSPPFRVSLARSIDLDLLGLNAPELESPRKKADDSVVSKANLNRTAFEGGESYITEVSSDGDFFVQLVSEEEQLQVISDNLETLMAGDQDDLECLEKGSVVCAKFTEDDMWYRANIEGVEGEQFTVRFVDYGNTDVLGKERLALMPGGLTLDSISPFAYKCRLSTAISQIEKFQAAVLDKLVSVALIASESEEENDVFTVSVEIDGQAYSENAKEEPSEVFEGQDEQVSTSSERITVTVSFVISPDQFYVQLQSDQAQLDTLMDELYEEITALAEGEGLVEETLAVGELCAALYEESWYRVRVESFEEDGSMQVLYIDHGNTETVSSKDELRALPEKFKALPVYGHEAKLPGIKPSGDSWTEEAIAAFKTLAEEKSMLADLISKADGEPWLLQLLDMGTPLQEILIVKGHGQGTESVKISKSTQRVFSDANDSVMVEDYSIPMEAVKNWKKKIGCISDKLQELEEVTAFVSHCDSPTQMWCQLSSSTDDLEVLADKLENAYSSPQDIDKATEFNADDLVIGIFEEDGMPYRSIVLPSEASESDEDKVCLRFIDYGNSSSCLKSVIFNIKEDLCEKPALSFCSCLAKVQPIDTEWSEEALNRFSELVLDQELLLVLVGRKQDGTVLVDLKQSESGQSLSEILLEEGLAKSLDMDLSLAAKAEKGDVSECLEITQPIMESTAVVDTSVCIPPYTIVPAVGGFYRNIELYLHNSYEIVICNDELPNAFCVQLKSFSEQLKSLNDGIAECMADDNDEKFSPAIGYPCLVSHEGLWYRGLPRTEASPETWLVGSVDYGWEMEVTADRLRALPPKLIELPTQAIHCYLAGIVSPEVEWSSEAISFFKDYVQQRELIINVLESAEDEKYGVTVSELLETSAEFSLSLNQLYVDKSFAEVVPGSYIDVQNQMDKTLDTELIDELEQSFKEVQSNMESGTTEASTGHADPFESTTMDDDNLICVKKPPVEDCAKFYQLVHLSKAEAENKNAEREANTPEHVMLSKKDMAFDIASAVDRIDQMGCIDLFPEDSMTFGLNSDLESILESSKEVSTNAVEDNCTDTTTKNQEAEEDESPVIDTDKSLKSFTPDLPEVSQVAPTEKEIPNNLKIVPVENSSDIQDDAHPLKSDIGEYLEKSAEDTLESGDNSTQPRCQEVVDRSEMEEDSSFVTLDETGYGDTSGCPDDLTDGYHGSASEGASSSSNDELKLNRCRTAVEEADCDQKTIEVSDPEKIVVDSIEKINGREDINQIVVENNKCSNRNGEEVNVIEKKNLREDLLKKIDNKREESEVDGEGDFDKAEQDKSEMLPLEDDLDKHSREEMTNVRENSGDEDTDVMMRNQECQDKVVANGIDLQPSDDLGKKAIEIREENVSHPDIADQEDFIVGKIHKESNFDHCSAKGGNKEFEKSGKPYEEEPKDSAPHENVFNQREQTDEDFQVADSQTQGSDSNTPASGHSSPRDDPMFVSCLESDSSTHKEDETDITDFSVREKSVQESRAGHSALDDTLDTYESASETCEDQKTEDSFAEEETTRNYSFMSGSSFDTSGMRETDQDSSNYDTSAFGLSESRLESSLDTSNLTSITDTSCTSYSYNTSATSVCDESSFKVEFPSIDPLSEMTNEGNDNEHKEDEDNSPMGAMLGEEQNEDKENAEETLNSKERPVEILLLDGKDVGDCPRPKNAEENEPSAPSSFHSAEEDPEHEAELNPADKEPEEKGGDCVTEELSQAEDINDSKEEVTETSTVSEDSEDVAESDKDQDTSDKKEQDLTESLPNENAVDDSKTGVEQQDVDDSSDGKDATSG